MERNYSLDLIQMKKLCPCTIPHCQSLCGEQRTNQNHRKPDLPPVPGGDSAVPSGGDGLQCMGGDTLQEVLRVAAGQLWFVWQHLGERVLQSEEGKQEG